MDMENVETIEKVFSEPFLLNRFFQIFVGRGYDPDVGADVFLAPDPAKSLGF
jgi:hypothetical protein